jgi:hypothetical protein
VSLPTRRKQVKDRDRATEQKLGIPKHDPESERFAGGNVYSRADIAGLEYEKLRFWRRRRRS